MTSQTEEPDEFEPATKVDPADGISEDDAVDIVETEQTDVRETWVDEERREELVDPDDEEEGL